MGAGWVVPPRQRFDDRSGADTKIRSIQSVTIANRRLETGAVVQSGSGGGSIFAGSIVLGALAAILGAGRGKDKPRTELGPWTREDAGPSMLRENSELFDQGP